MNALSGIVFLLALSASADAANVINVLDSLDPVPQYRSARIHPSLASLLELPSDINLDPRETYVTVHGTTRCRYRQMYLGEDVIDTILEADVDEKGNYFGGAVTGVIYLDLAKDLQDRSMCSITEQEAINKVLTEEGLSTDSKIQTQQILKKVFVDGNNKAHWVYTVDILVEMTPRDVRPYYYIDRCDGSVLLKSERFVQMSTSLRWFTGSEESWANESPQSQAAATSSDKRSSGTCSVYVNATGGNPKTGLFQYSTPPYCLDVVKVGDDCFLDNTYVRTFDLKQTTNTNVWIPVKFVCDQGYNDAINDSPSPCLDAHFHATTSFTMFQTWLGSPPLSTKPYLMVHYGQNLVNAYWTGSNMLFGDGDTYTYPLVDLDVVAHELGHGFTEQHAGLVYSGQSGGIDEAFCDISGAAAEYFLRSATDWQVGAGIFKSPTQAVRYFDDPTKDWASIKNASLFTTGMDVHYSSGVFNHAFYKMVEEKNINLRNAFEAFGLANKQYWKENTDFVEGACGVIRAAYDQGLDTVKVSAAFEEVAVTACPITPFLEMLTTTAARNNVKASTVRRPVFGIQTLADTNKITVTATSASGATITLDLLGSLTSAALTSGSGSVVLTSAAANTLYYVQLYTQSQAEVSDITVSLQF